MSRRVRGSDSNDKIEVDLQLRVVYGTVQCMMYLLVSGPAYLRIWKVIPVWTTDVARTVRTVRRNPCFVNTRSAGFSLKKETSDK